MYECFFFNTGSPLHRASMIINEARLRLGRASPTCTNNLHSHETAWKIDQRPTFCKKKLSTAEACPDRKEAKESCRCLKMCLKQRCRFAILSFWMRLCSVKGICHVPMARMSKRVSYHHCWICTQLSQSANVLSHFKSRGFSIPLSFNECIRFSLRIGTRRRGIQR